MPAFMAAAVLASFWTALGGYILFAIAIPSGCLS